MMFWLMASAGPLAWILEMGINFSFSYAACAGEKRWQLILVAAVACAVSLGGMWSAASMRRAVVEGSSAAHFKATVAMALNGIFALLIVAQALVVLLTRGCA